MKGIGRSIVSTALLIVGVQALAGLGEQLAADLRQRGVAFDY